MANWKQHERNVAKDFGGKRNIDRAVDFSRSAGDIKHETFTIECKYRVRVPKLVTDSLGQARKYDPKKIPVAALKSHNMIGYIVCMHSKDFHKLLERKNGNDQGVESEVR